MKNNRWLIALSAMGLHICIGSVYAWSVLTKPITETMGFTLKETTWTFSLAILFLGLSHRYRHWSNGFPTIVDLLQDLQLWDLVLPV